MRGLAIAAAMNLAAMCGGCAAPGLGAADGGTDGGAEPDGGCIAAPGVLEGERSVASRNLPALVWTGAAGEVRLDAFHAPCAAPGTLVVLRQLAAWSAPALWHVGHTAPLASMPGVTVLDLWAADGDAMPMTPAQLSVFSGFYDVAPGALVADPDETLGPLALAGIALPLVAVVDARTLHVERVLTDPRAGEVEQVVRAVQARLAGEPLPRTPDPVLVDGRFSRDRWDLIVDMARVPVPSASPSNAVADRPEAAALGHGLFEDPSISPAGVSCASCHDAARAFTDARPRGMGIAEVRRNTPTLLGAAWVRWPFWDGRADSLWAQALGPIESPEEMGSTRLEVAHRIAAAYRGPYETLFGALPPLEQASRFPARGMPGEPAWEAMDAADREAVTRVFANAGKALEAYQRTLPLPVSPLAAYVGGDFDALTQDQRHGLESYLVAGCAQCHSGPLLTNGAFHSIAMPGVGEGPDLDLGRASAFEALRASPFRAQGAFSDAPGTPDPLARLSTVPAATRGAFRTPTLRGIRLSAPYGHAGTFTGLRDVVRHYGHVRTLDPDPRVAGPPDPHLREFDDEHIDPIVRFLEIL